MLNANATPGHVLTATATRIVPGFTYTDTSEFSLAQMIKAAPTATNLDLPAITYLDGVANVELPNIVISDVDGDQVTARLVVRTVANGSLTSNDGATYNAATGVWSITGSVAQVNTALSNVQFLPGTYNTADTTITVQIEDVSMTRRSF